MKTKDKKRVLDFLRGELPIEDLESEILGELATATREEFVTVTAEKLELSEKVTSLEGNVKDLTEKLEAMTADKEEATNRIKEFEELEKTRVSNKKETLLASIKDEISQLGLTIPEKEESILKDLDNCQLETLEQMYNLLKVAESADLTGLQQEKPKGNTEESKEDETEKTKPEDALPKKTGSSEPSKPHATLEKIRNMVGINSKSSKS